MMSSVCRRPRLAAFVGVLGVTIFFGLGGCGRKKPAPQTIQEDAAQVQRNSTGAAAVTALPLDPRLHQPFATAVLQEPPGDWPSRPPDKTMTGKSVGKLYTEVVSLWDEIKFVSPTGKKLAYQATLETDAGMIVIALLPESAPNHVRSFIALARTGYYDGLVFERLVRESVTQDSSEAQEAQEADARLELIEAGCPLGSGDLGCGSIGYWLKAEIDPKLSHEEGAVGACRCTDADSAGCKFFINLRKAPFMDGQYTIFGKVTQGLDVARNILRMPVRRDSEYPTNDRPVQPIVIRKVTIRTREIE